MDVREYETSDGVSPFGVWFDDLDARAAAKVTVAVARIGQGAVSNVKGVGSGVFEFRLDYGPGYRIYFGKAARCWWSCSPAAPSGGSSAISMPRTHAGRTTRIARKVRRKMVLTRSFKDTVQARAQRDPAFREALLADGVDALLSGDMEAGKAVLRDYINATIGFEKLAAATGAPSKSLMRMFSPAGNPTARNLFGVLGELQKQSGVQLHARSTTAAA